MENLTESPAAAPAAPAGRRERPWREIAAVLVVGLALVAAPLAFSMFERAPKGAAMIDGFAPYMTDERLATYERHVADLDAGIRQSETAIAALLGGPGAVDARSPAFAAFRATWPAIRDDMTAMLATIRANVPNYEAVAALPDFALFPWFFVAPGVLLVLLALAAAGPATWRRLRWGVVAVGVGLVAAPLAFSMFERAPKGAQMIAAFQTIETHAKVEQIQGYFGEIAVGQGAIRLELVPALERRGLTPREIEQRFPAAVAIVERWPSILGDLTPLIGAMSDNVDNYDAVRALPSFRLLPWLFVAASALVVLVVAGGRRRRASDPLTGGAAPA
ncbi:MAG: hypothetical protein Q8O56_05195 [Solirubrobacteraceae bacterium]|nr:hypothetical protein [Solirubrobacteraceae bacterium]